MKTQLLIIIIVATGMMFSAGCQKDETPTDVNLTVNQSDKFIESSWAWGYSFNEFTQSGYNNYYALSQQDIPAEYSDKTHIICSDIQVLIGIDENPFTIVYSKDGIIYVRAYTRGGFIEK